LAGEQGKLYLAWDGSDMTRGEFKPQRWEWSRIGELSFFANGKRTTRFG
jgi:hypothetical protein